MSEMFLKPSQTSKMKLLLKIVNGSRGAFRTQLNIKYEYFCENDLRLKVVNFFRKELHLRYSAGF